MPNDFALVLRKKPFIRPGHRNASSAYNSESTTVTRALSPSSCSFLPCNGLPVCLLIFTYLNGALTLELGFAKFVLGGGLCSNSTTVTVLVLCIGFTLEPYRNVLGIAFYAGLPARYIRTDALKSGVTSRPPFHLDRKEASMN
jgi:hypothetical protein